jgi:hypothetical protein
MSVARLLELPALRAGTGATLGSLEVLVWSRSAG